MNKPTLPRAVLEELEPRILYSADLAAVLGAAADGSQSSSGAVQEQQLLRTEAQTAPAHEIAFVDLAAPAAHELVAGLAAQRDSGRNIEIVTIAADADGLAVISQTLASRQGVTAVHLLSHGSSGQVQLGTAVLDNGSALARAEELAAWSLALTPDADLLIYGCDVAASSEGQQLMQALAALVGADVAASDDATGAARLGGDWQLEHHTGPIEAVVAADAPLQAGWDQLLGTEFRVNSTTAQEQDTLALNRGSQHAVAFDAAGNYVVVWTSKDQDGNAEGVYARRFSFNGVALTPEIRVHSTTTGVQNMASVASDSAGNFVVVWSGAEGGGNGTGVYVRRFSGNGTALTAEAKVQTSNVGDQTNPTLAMNRSTGAFVVAWQGQGGTDSDGIYFRRYGANASATDATQRAGNTSNAGVEQNPAVAMDITGRIVIAYDVNGHVYTQRFDAAGAAQGSAVMADVSYTVSSRPAVAMDDAGNFTVLYADSVTQAVLGRGYNSDGTQRSFYYLMVDNGGATSPSLAMAGDGAFVVTYEKTGADKLDVFARKYNANGSANGAAFAVNAYSANDQRAASVALLSKDDFVVVWSGEEAVDNQAVMARTFEAAAAAPVISSNGGAATAAVSVAENSTAVTTVAATDSNRPAQTLVYSISGGADAARFSINASTGALRFTTAPNFEAPQDSGANNVYNVTVQVSDGTLVDTQALAVTVTDVGGPLTVSTLADVLDGDTSSVEALLGNMGADGKISLREAITATNNTAGTDTILLGVGQHNLTINGAGDDNNVNGDLDVRDNLVISGAGASVTAVSGGGSLSVFHVISGSLTMSGLTVRDGVTLGDGAGIQVAAGAALNLSQAVVRNNTSALLGNAGGIFSQGALTLTDVEVRDNSAAQIGGGIAHLGTTMTLTRVTLAGNSADSAGGVYAFGTGVQTLTNVTLSGNTAASFGGGVVFETNATLLNVTVASNSAGTSGGGLYNDQAPNVTLRNVLLSGNTGGNLVNNAGGYTSLGNNLSSEASAVLVAAGDRPSTPGNLSALADNGGFGRTHALLVASQARNGGNSTAGVAPTTDQRGVARVGNVDIGAYEYTAANNEAPVNTLPASLTVLEDQTTAVAGVSVQDPNLNDGTATWRVASTALSATQGTMGVTLVGATTISAGANNSAALTLAGTETDINATLATLTFRGAAHYNGSATLTMTTVDGAGLSATSAIAITVTSVNDAPAGSDATLTVGASLQRVLARADFGFSDVVGPGDSNAFSAVLVQLPSAGTLRLAGTALNAATSVTAAQLDAGSLVFEAAPGASGPGHATLAFQVRDSGGTSAGGMDQDPTPNTLSFDILNRAPAFDSPSSAASATLSLREGRSAVTTLHATDPDADAVALYSISGGADAALFTIDGGTGELRFTIAPDFENPADTGADNTYEVSVQVTDGSLTDTLALSLVITDVEHQISVTTTADLMDGDTTSIDALFTNPGADGEVSLREALTAANNTPGLDTIDFSISAPLVAGAHTIALTSELPALNSPVFINGRSEPDFAGTPVIEINGSAAGAGAHGLRLDPGSDGSTVAALAINRFNTDALQVWGSGSHTIVGNHLGTDVSGRVAQGNLQAGLWMAGWTSTIGGTAAADANVIAGNGGSGLQIDNGAHDVVVIGNRIGVGLGGETLANFYGVRLDSGATNVRIGGTAAGQGNQIAHNTEHGIVLAPTAGDGNAWLGNAIYSNGLMAVDLGDDGPTSNDAGDADSGPNDRQNHPVLASVLFDGVNTAVTGTLSSNASTTYRIEFFSAPAADSAGRGDGTTFVGATSVTTSAAGSASFNVTLTGFTPNAGDVFSAVAVVDLGAGAYGSASELAPAVAVAGLNTAPSITSNGAAASASLTVPENTVAVTTVQATDADLPAQPLTYSIIGGADAARFAIDGSTGALRFVVAPAYAAPTDSDGNNAYEVIVQASDGVLTDSQALTVSVLSTSTVPVAAPDTYAVVEDQPFATTVASGWFDAAWSQRQAITFSNASGPLMNDVVVLVTLDGSTVDYATIQNGGQDLRFVTPAGQLLVHEVEHWDEAGVSSVWVKVPRIGAASTTDSIWMYSGNPAAADGQQVGATWPSAAAAVVHMGSTLTDSSASNNVISQNGTTVVAGRMGQSRQFDGSTSWVSLGSAAALDNLFLGGGTLSAWINPTGWGEAGYGRVASKSDSLFAAGGNGNGWALQLSGAAQALIFEIGFSGSAGRWTTPTGSISLNTWQRVTVSYDNTSAANTPRVFINDVEVALTRNATPSGAPTSDAALPLRLGNQALTTDRTFAGRIDEVRAFDFQATAASNAAGYVGATGALVGSIGAPQRATPGVLNNDDPRAGGALVAELISGPSHAAGFTLNSDGTFSYVPAADYSGADSFIYRARNASVAGSPVAVTLNIAGRPDAPVITTAGGAPTVALTVPEGSVQAVAMTATDADGPAPALVWSVVGGVDAARFSVNGATGVLQFVAVPDFETPTDAGADNTYDVVVQVSDGSLLDTQALRVTVADVNEWTVSALADVDATPNQALETAAAGSAVGITARAVDADGSNNTVSYTLTNNGGGRFAIDGSTGVVTLARVLGEEGAVVHTVTVRADSADGSFSSADFNIAAVPVNNQTPVITSGGAGASSSVSLAEGQTVVGTVSASDADLPPQSLQYRISGGADAALFTIDGASGVLRFIDTPDFETPLDADGNGVYELNLAASDGTLQDQQALSVQVLNVDEAPAWLHNRLVISEGGTAAPTVVAFDVDSSAALLRYQVQGLTGGRFESLAAPGVAITVFTQAELNAGQVVFMADGGEAAPSYQLLLSDATTHLPALAAAVDFTPVNDAPTALPRDLGVIDEDGSLVIDIATLLAGASDADGDALAFSSLRLTGGNASLQDLGGGRWQLDAAADWSGTVSLSYTVSDGAALATSTAQLQVRAVNDAPLFTSFAGAAAADLLVLENSSTVTVLTAADIDSSSGALRFSIGGGADAALFSIDDSSGVLRFITSPDRETPRDADGNGRYEVTVAVSDGQASSVQALGISIGDVNEPPVLTKQTLLLSAQGSTLLLQANDAEALPGQLVYEVLMASGGYFERAGAAGRASPSFTQADVDAGLVRFVDLGAADAPTFRLALSDGAHRIELPAPDVLRSTLPLVAEAPPVAAAASAEPPASVAAVAAIPAPAPAKKPEAAADPVIELQPINDAPLPVYQALDTSLTRAQAAQAPAASAARSDAVEQRQALTPAGSSFWLQTIAELQLATDGLIQAREHSGYELFSSRSGSSLAQAMDTMRLGEQAAGGPLQMDSAGTVLVSSGLSVGYVLWLARGGALVASLMSSVPAWASVDPLPVLSQVRRERDGDEGAEGDEIDPVDRLFSRARRLLGSAPPPAPPSPGDADADAEALPPAPAPPARKQREEPTWAS